MSGAARILLGYVVVLAVSGWLMLSAAFDVLKPGMRQSAEETLVDTANLLAALVAEDLGDGRVADGFLANHIDVYLEAEFNAEIWDVPKTRPNHRIYVTDAEGTVVFDSAGRDVGADYSRWNDVWRTLRGEYGARTTAESEDETSTVMYVAAPVLDGDRIIGVLSVGKPNVSMQPFIERAEQRVWLGAALALGGALVIALAATWWHTRPVRALVAYARGVAEGRHIALPPVREPELAVLASALHDMRVELEGKEYIEHYVQALTHELKSPLASITSASELLHEELDRTDRERLLDNIEHDASRMVRLIERLLTLARIEQRRGPEAVTTVDLSALCARLLNERRGLAEARKLTVEMNVPRGTSCEADPFLLELACANLLDNALEFAPPQGMIRIDVTAGDDATEIRVFNQGEAIPEYALPRLSERFYALPRPRTGLKSSGLGLSLVREAAELHGGSFSIANADGGVTALIRLPRT